MATKSRTRVEAPGPSNLQVKVVESDHGDMAVFLGLRVCDKPGEAAAPEGNTVGTVFTLDQATELAGMLLHAVATAAAMAEQEGQQVVQH